MRPDIATAWAKVTNKGGRRRDIKKLPEYLNGGEVVVGMAGGLTGGNRGLLVATNRRALFVSEGVINHSFEDFLYDRITTVTTTRSLLAAKILIHTGGVTRVVEIISKSEAETVAAIIRERIEATTRERADRQHVVTTTSADAPIRLAAELRDLSELHTQGVLTDEEFSELKARLLAR